MTHVPGLGRLLVLFGIVLVLAGALLSTGIRLPRLPGDVVIRRNGVFIYLPIATSVVLSLVLTLLLSLVFRER